MILAEMPLLRDPAVDLLSPPKLHGLISDRCHTTTVV